MSTRRTIIGMLGAMALFVIGGAAVAQERGDAAPPPGRTALNETDRLFIKEASISGLAEVRLGKLAVEKGGSVEVKQFGQRMVDDHGRANNKLVQLAGVKGITVPAELPAAQKEQIQRLSGLSGEAFDRAYMEQMIKDHARAVANFEDEIKNGQDQDIKNFSASTLSVLRDHLQEVRKIAGTDASSRR